MTLETKAHPDTDIKAALGDLLYTFEQFKATNDERLDELERRGTEDPLVGDRLSRVDAALMRQQALLDRLTAKA